MDSPQSAQVSRRPPSDGRNATDRVFSSRMKWRLAAGDRYRHAHWLATGDTEYRQTNKRSTVDF